jgi:hypothetical protein
MCQALYTLTKHLPFASERLEAGAKHQAIGVRLQRVDALSKVQNKAFPGNLSGFNLKSPTLDGLDPEVRKNVMKYYPPSKV